MRFMESPFRFHFIRNTAECGKVQGDDDDEGGWILMQDPVPDLSITLMLMNRHALISEHFQAIKTQFGLGC